MEFFDVQMGFKLGTLKETIIEPNQGCGWVIMLRDIQDNLTPLTAQGHKQIFEDFYFATSFAHTLGSKQISVLDSFI